jgi:membrane protease YdiL (CAAX protease family)
MRTRLQAAARLALYCLLVFVVFPAKGRWLRAGLHGGDDATYVIDHLIELAAILLFAWIAARAERRPFGVFGLPFRRWPGRNFLVGTGAGLAGIVVLVMALDVQGALHVSGPSSPSWASAGFGLLVAVVFALLAVREEFLYRGYGVFTMTRVTGFWLAAMASSAWFTQAHTGPNETVIGLVSVGIYGLLSCFVLLRTGNLWMNWGQTYLFGVGDSGHAAGPMHLFTTAASPSAPAWLSGGVVGPEGSILCLVLLVLIWVACTRLPRGTQDLSSGTAMR